MKTLYTTTVTSKGGREGKVESENGVLSLEVKTPKAMGGANDDYANPEMLFAAGYSACFGSALSLVIGKSKMETGETSVTAKVSIGKTDDGGYGLAVEMDVNIPGVSLEEAQSLSDQAHQVCPYSNATRGNIEVKIAVSNN
ncbi:organic hydroperoxide resistance protein [Halpernia frigidisoli]|uniref:Peroxiredoxin, Ohr subfamily n=1 Tax=Halpernia frigidisoli TaxID=1125876 RepID=A0A1I3EFA8_9FLAO|nr:organic hydroperoxide resistance protein [Halpernia frigidisoli]SFH97584.1 peroxiredoxin, Ohr subfamily [Halpernia frigidisoli]